MHSGMVSLDRLEPLNGSWCVYVKFHGGCIGCPSATAGTLKSVEMCLRDEMDASGLIVKNADFE